MPVTSPIMNKNTPCHISERLGARDMWNSSRSGGRHIVDSALAIGTDIHVDGGHVGGAE
uniref:Uncharacterized protein n=1 Tax=Mycobacterium riyadhense TaxID=486698 RepID=A0A653EG95_9MYCO|nr:hypothetical protein BIN_B_01122 [Mycobacterium riyadhense]